MGKAQRPQWLRDLLLEPWWALAQVWSVLLGDDPADGPPASDPFADANWDPAQKRVARLVEAASARGELAIRYTRDRDLDTPYGDGDVERDAVIRWVVARKRLFPSCPLTPDDIPAESRVPDRLPQQVLRLLEIVKKTAGQSQKEIAAAVQKEFGVSTRDAQALAAFIRSDEAVAQDKRASRRRR